MYIIIGIINKSEVLNLVVTVEGVVMEVTQVEGKEGKAPSQRVLLYQQGEKELSTVKLPENRNGFSVGEVTSFTGRLLTWKQREGIGAMVMVE